MFRISGVKSAAIAWFCERLIVLAGTFRTDFVPGAGKKSEYRAGDRLPQEGPGPRLALREILWVVLMPKDWDPARDFENLGLSHACYRSKAELVSALKR